MTDSINVLAKELAKAIPSKSKTSPYDTQAVVKRIDGDIAWVHIPGGVDETPVQMTSSAKKGDIVQVRVSGGRAWLYGNATNPPTDDSKANEVSKNLVRTENEIYKTIVYTEESLSNNINSAEDSFTYSIEELLTKVEENDGKHSDEYSTLESRLTAEINQRISESLTNEEGLNRVIATDDGLEISGTEQNNSDTILKITNNLMAFMIKGAVEAILTIYADGELGSYIQSDIASFQMLQLKNRNNNVSLGWIAQENGHVTLKEV